MQKTEIPEFTEKEVKQALAVVMMCVTQHGLVNELFPETGEEPKFDSFTDVGADIKLLKKFVDNANKTHAAPVFAHYCEAVAAVYSTITQNYSGPYCPNGKIFEDVNGVVNA